MSGPHHLYSSDQFLRKCHFQAEMFGSVDPVVTLLRPVYLKESRRGRLEDMQKQKHSLISFLWSLETKNRFTADRRGHGEKASVNRY